MGKGSEEKPRQLGQRGGRLPKETVVGPRGHVSYQPGSLWGNRRVPVAPGPRATQPQPPAARLSAPGLHSWEPATLPRTQPLATALPFPCDVTPLPSPRGGEEPWRVWSRAELG